MAQTSSPGNLRIFNSTTSAYNFVKSTGLSYNDIIMWTAGNNNEYTYVSIINNPNSPQNVTPSTTNWKGEDSTGKVTPDIKFPTSNLNTLKLSTLLTSVNNSSNPVHITNASATLSSTLTNAKTGQHGVKTQIKTSIYQNSSIDSVFPGKNRITPGQMSYFIF